LVLWTRVRLLGQGGGAAVAVLLCGAAQCGRVMELLETRYVRKAFKIMPVQIDSKDAQGIAALMRRGWFRPVHCKPMEAQEEVARRAGQFGSAATLIAGGATPSVIRRRVEVRRA
jgi:hypothetical protein